jgi:hypothetical protein
MENTIRHKGPHLGILAILFMSLFIFGLSFVVSFKAGAPHYPNPYDPLSSITSYFAQHPRDALFCAFFQFCSAIPLALFAVNALAQLRFLGIKATGPFIAMAGGLITAINVIITSATIWTMANPAVSGNASVIPALYYLGFAIGGAGYSVPLGLLIAGISVSGGLSRVLPKWLMWSGLVLALIGELSGLSLLVPGLLPLVPLTRFPGFIWLIIVGFRLPRKKN